MKSVTSPERPPEKNDAGAMFARQDAPISEWPFFLIVVAALLFIYVISVLQTPALQEPAPLALFTILILIYAALFWAPLLVRFDKRKTIAYLFVQASLAFVLSYFVGGAVLVFGLFAPLLGITVGMIPNWRVAAVAIVGLLGLSTLAVGISSGWSALQDWPWLAIPLTIFIIIYVILYGRQAEAREQAQELAARLEAANLELADYAAQVEELTLVAERQRMARELHDTLAQGVAGLILQLEAVNANLEQGDAGRAQEIVRQAMVRARSTLAEARRAIDDLREGDVEEPADLATSVRGEVARFSATTGTRCHVDIDLAGSVPAESQICAERAISEALSNVARHARASEVWVRLASGDGTLLVEVRDNGVGFDTGAPIPAGHYGLQGMRERARLIGGAVEIESEVDTGTTLRMQIPLRDYEQVQPEPKGLEADD